MLKKNTDHALMRAGGFSAQLRPLLLALRQLIKGFDRLRLASLRKRSNDLELMLVPFVTGLGVMGDSGSALKPQADQARAIEAAVSALTSSVLAVDLGPSLPDASVKQDEALRMRASRSLR